MLSTPEILRKAEDLIALATPIIAKGNCKAAGYRIKILPIGADTELKAGEKEKFSELAKLGFTATSDRQAMRETRGTDHAIVMDIGPGAYKSPHLEAGGPWVKPGQVIRYLRYAGLEFEEPPGSGVVYRLINDEDVLGFYEETL